MRMSRSVLEEVVESAWPKPGVKGWGVVRNPRRLRPCTMTWEARDGKKTRVCDMKDSHLLNALLYVERNAALLQAGNLVTCDFAEDWDLKELGETPEEWLLEYKPYRRLYNEARRRRLVVVPISRWFTRAYDTPFDEE
jgi:hypothetical protein